MGINSTASKTHYDMNRDTTKNLSSNGKNVQTFDDDFERDFLKYKSSQRVQFAGDRNNNNDPNIPDEFTQFNEADSSNFGSTPRHMRLTSQSAYVPTHHM